MLHHFSCRKSVGSLKMCPSSFHLLSIMVIDSGFVHVILHSLLLDILCGHWIPIIYLSCLLWKLFTPQVPQLRNSTLFTSVSYSRTLVVSFVFQLFFHIVSFFSRTMVANYFLPQMSSWSPSFDSSFITFVRSLSPFFDLLFTVVHSVFSLFTNRCLLVIISFAFS